jgi:tetratricopeptide (TPR) repeat protein
MSERTARGIGLDFGGGVCRVMAVEGSQYQPLLTAPTPQLISHRSSGGDSCPWRRESIKRYTGMEKVVDVRGRESRTDDVLTAFLRQVKHDAETELKAIIRGLVVSIPPCFTDRQRAATKHWAEAAGFGAVALVDDSKAAALDYAVRTKQRGKWLLYGLGRSVFFATILEGTEPKQHNGDVHLGGDDFDCLIADRLARAGADWRAFEPLMKAAEKCKRLLSEREEVAREDFWPDAPGGLRFSLRRADFERLIEPTVSRTLEMAEQTVREEGLAMAEMDRILLLGGSTKIPLIRRRLEGLCPNGIVDLPEDAVARGAALYATTMVGTCFEREARVADHPGGMPPKMVEAWRKVQEAYERDALEEVIALYREFIDVAREDLSGMYQRRARQLAAPGQEEAAISLLKKGLECCPGNTAIRKQLSEHYIRSARGSLEAARNARTKGDLKLCFRDCEGNIEESLRYDPGNAEATRLRERLKIAKRQAG